MCGISRVCWVFSSPFPCLGSTVLWGPCLHLQWARDMVLQPMGILCSAD